MSDYGRLGDGLGGALKVLLGLAVLGLVLGLWKLVEIAVWVWRHVNVSVE